MRWSFLRGDDAVGWIGGGDERMAMEMMDERNKCPSSFVLLCPPPLPPPPTPSSVHCGAGLRFGSARADFYTRADLFLLSCKGMQAALLARFVPKEKRERSFWASKASSTFTVVSLCEKTEEYSLLFVPPLDFCTICSVPLQATLLVVNIAKVSSDRLEDSGFETATVSDVLKSKGKSADGSWLWCTTEDTVYDAVKSMTHNNVGALVVVKPGEDKSIAGIVTERDYLRKIIVQGRSSKSTKVGDIMTEENKLITVNPNTKVLQAMQLMTDNRIRHIPVIDGTGMLGMVSIGDAVRAVVAEYREELNRLNDYIQGGY
ncbi:unnamed protein product [Miscanthus lutarioriparius]|uniref:CBS domain-containing protein n=1 Tax=Miscanthus lutarioriparius TaxID=422564 RepID=A0A811MHR0_9POAL|nr:unnamed protein product [Miscanthus lutarioriparius]